MIKTEKKVVYEAFGFRISSEIPLPELVQMNMEDDTIDVDVKVSDLSHFNVEINCRPYKFVVNEGTVIFHIPNIAYFSIEEGSRITVYPLNEADEDLIRVYILGTCMGAILIQRKIIPLHGSAVAINGKVYAFIGGSGAGKSTLATAFLNKGYPLLTDDVIAVSLNQDNTPIVTPSYPQQKLWQESLTEFGMESSQYHPIFQRETKFAVPVTAKFSSEPLPLAGVFELVKGEIEKIEISQVKKLASLQTVFFHTYRNFLIPKLGLMDWHFKSSSKIVSRIGMFQIQRPTTSFTAYQLVSNILDLINKEEIR